MVLASFRYLLKASKDAFQRQAGEVLRACIVALPGLGHDDMLVAWHAAQAGQYALAANRRNLPCESSQPGCRRQNIQSISVGPIKLDASMHNPVHNQPSDALESKGFLDLLSLGHVTFA